MSSYAHKPNEGSRQSVSAENAQKSGSAGGLQIVDNRSEAVAQRKLQDLMDDGIRTKQPGVEGKPVVQRVLAAVHGNRENSFVKLVNRILKGHAKLTYNATTHVFALQDQGGAKTELPSDGKKLRSVLQNIISNANTTTINFAELDPRVFIGGFDEETIDVSDARKFGVFNDGSKQGVTAAAGLVHELHEQFRKQVHHEDIGVAHNDHAVPAEEEAIDGFREGSTAKDYTEDGGLGDYTQKTKYSYLDGTVVIVHVTVANHNVESVKRKKYKSITAFRNSADYEGDTDANMDDEDVIAEKVDILTEQRTALRRKLRNATAAIARLPKKKKINRNWRTNPQLQKRKAEKKEIEARLASLNKLIRVERGLLAEFND